MKFISSNKSITRLKAIIIIALGVSFIFVSDACHAQFNIDQNEGSGYYNDNYLRLANYNYQPNIKSVTLHRKDWPLSNAIIDLNEDVTLELSFDVLDSSLGNYMYSFVHCDHNWNQSDLSVQEYVDGPPEDYLTEYDYSRNTFQKFIHYSLEIPNFNVRLTKSGNYIVKVYEAGNPDELVLTRRFSITEDLNDIQIGVKVHQATRVKERYSHQEVDFDIAFGNYELTNPYTDLHIVVLQNNCWENALIGLEPRFVKDRLLDYNYDGENTFPGQNEYRFFDIQNTRYNGQGVERISFQNKENHAYLVQDKSRSAITYLQRPDINGWYFIKTVQSNAVSAIDADYVTLHFSLSQNSSIPNGDVYIYGALTDWKITPEAKMQFNQSNLQYEANMYLKQGLYNYQYVFVADGQSTPDMSYFEGSHYETENDYTILVYHRKIGLDYDRLIKTTEFKYTNN
jgi:hypothetical protein